MEAVVEMVVVLLMGRGVGQPRLLGNMSVWLCLRLCLGACLISYCTPPLPIVQDRITRASECGFPSLFFLFVGHLRLPSPSSHPSPIPAHMDLMVSPWLLLVMTRQIT